MDKIHIFYVPHPSHGHRTNIPPIETRDQLLGVAIDYDPQQKIVWHETDFWYEGQQRDYAVKTVANDGADIILVCDYDEIWLQETLEKVLDFVGHRTINKWLVNMVHLWRSFDWCVRDDAWPVRLWDLRHPDGLGYVPRELGEVYHFGYAVTDKVMSYKWECHGHKDELRPDWYESKWLAWPPPVEDCHPTNGRKTNGEGYWTTEPFDKNNLPAIMRKHPFWDKERIE